MRTPVIGVLSPLLAGPFFGTVIKGVTEVVATAGGTVLAMQTLDSRIYDEHADVPDFDLPVGWDHADAFVVVTKAVHDEYLFQLRGAGKPIVLVSHELDSLDAPQVRPDNAIGVREAVHDLVRHGHRRIAFTGRLEQPDIRERYEAYVATMAKLGLNTEGMFYDSGGYMESHGIAVARRFVADGMPATAIITGNDMIALPIMTALQSWSIRIPQDVAVVGFDDMPASSVCHPPLATVSQSVDRMGAYAARLALDLAAGRPVAGGRHLLPTSFVPRRSCGCTGTAMHPVDLDEPAVLDGAVDCAVPCEPEAGHACEPAASQTDVGADSDEAGCRILGLLPPALRDDARPLALELVQVLRTIVDGDLRRCGDHMTRVSDLVNRLYDVHPRPQTLNGVMDAALNLLPPDAALADGAAILIRELAAVLAQPAGASWVRTAERVQTILRSDFDVTRGMVQSDDPHDLHWLREAGLAAGALGVWTRPREQLSTRTVISGGAQGPATGTEGEDGEERLAVESFPPASLLELAAGSLDPVFVLPLRTAIRSWGLVSLVGPVETTTPTGREAYFHWSGLLAAALDRSEMLASLHQQQRDLTSAYQRERHLVEEVRVSEQRYALAAEAANDGLWDWDLEGGTIYLAPRWAALFGYTPDELGADPREWLGRVHPDDREELEAAVLASRARCLPLEHEHRMLAKDGAYRWVLVRALPVPGTEGHAVRLVGSHTDTTERKQLEDRLRYQAMYDPLTGLPNRTLFFDRLERAVAHLERRADVGFAVLFLDLDGFKVVNDSLGHLTGDLLLVRVAERLTRHLRDTDTAARLGGDEFAILLTDVNSSADVLKAVDRLQALLAEPYDLQGHPVVATASVGIAMSQTGYTHAEEVLRDADIAMYRAKSHERGTFMVFDTAMHEGAVSRLRTESDLRRAVDAGELEPHYQPIVDLASGNIFALEALVRWRHPERGLIPPGDFLAVAEETGLIVPLGRAVIDAVCDDLARWKAEGLLTPQTRVSVNLSNREFWQGDLLAELDRALARAGMSAQWLTFEITEGVVMGNAEEATDTLRQLQERGLHLHIDDFGTGYSSLEALHRFPIHALKIDRSFVFRLESEQSSRELVRTIALMGRNLGIDVIAEGVESARQQELLLELGCQYGQGYWFARPAPAREVERALRHGTASAAAIGTSSDSGTAPAPTPAPTPAPPRGRRWVPRARGGQDAVDHRRW